MHSERFDLRKIFDLEKWQYLQDAIAQSTGLAIIMTDYYGTPVVRHSAPCEFCKRTRSNPETSVLCEKCDAHGGLEAVRFRAPYIYLCHSNIVDMAIPIVIDDVYCGAIMAGQILLRDDSNTPPLEKILPMNDDGMDEEMSELYGDIPKFTFEKISNIAKMLSSMCDYIVKEAVGAKYLFAGQAEMSMPPNQEMINDFFQLSPEPKWHGCKTESGAIEDGHLLRPISNWLKGYPVTTLSLNDAARLCNLSASHFGRLFKKAYNENYTKYCLAKRIAYAKQMLETTDMSISQIAEKAGFYDPSHFIRTFKEHEKITPSEYRKRYSRV